MDLGVKPSDAGLESQPEPAADENEVVLFIINILGVGSAFPRDIASEENKMPSET